GAGRADRGPGVAGVPGAARAAGRGRNGGEGQGLMRPLSCEEVDELLPWCGAGEGEPEQRGLVEQHLAHCPRCRQGYGEAERLSALLDWHHRETEGLERLRARLREESRRDATRRAVLPFVRR